MKREMGKNGNNAHTYTPALLDTKLGYPMACRLRIMYKRTMKEDWECLENVNIKKFARFIGKIFKMKVPKIRLIKEKKMKKKYGETGLYGVCEVEYGKCKKILLEKEMVKEGNGGLIYFVLLHELRHCWQVTDYQKYYGEQEDTPNLQALREADAQAFAELIMYYLFEYSYSYEEHSKAERQQIEFQKNEIRLGLWEQIKKYYRFHGGFRGRGEIRRIDRETYGRKK